MSRKKLFTSILLIVIGLLGTTIYIKVNGDTDSSQSLLINEVCSHNETIVYNDIGIYTDYVELYNNSDDAIDLGDYFLSDKEERLDLFSLPEEELLPYSYTVVFIDRETAKFCIGDEESIYLSDSEGNIIDAVTLPIMDNDMVYARGVSDLQWQSNLEASPGKANAKVKEEVNKIEDENSTPVFSANSGFYEEPFYLEISVDNKYDVYYTLDGSVPTEDSYYYEEPIYIYDASDNENLYSVIEEISIDERQIELPEYLVDKCTIVRAVAIAADGGRSEETYGTYFVGYDSKYGYGDTYVISIITDPNNLFSKDKGIYVTGNLAEKHWYGGEQLEEKHDAITNYTREGKGWKKPAYAQLFDESGEVLYNQQIKIGIHGNYCTLLAQKGFNMFPENTEYIFEGLLGGASTSLMLRPGGAKDWRYTQFRDALNHMLVEDRELVVQQAVPCQVFLDGEYWGLYNLQERIDQGLVAETYGVNAEDVIVTKNNHLVGEDDSYYELYRDVISFVESHDLAIHENYAEVEKMIDIQSYIDYYCFQIYVAACDTIGNNYSCWRTKTVSTKDYYDGKWRWVLYDTDDSTGARKELSNVTVDSFSGGHMTITPMEDVLFSSLIQNEEFKYRFVSTFVEMADTNFAPERVNAIIAELSDKYMEAAVLSHRRWLHGEYYEDEYWERVEVVINFFEKRKSYIMKHLENNLEIDDVEEYLRKKGGL